MKLSDITEYRIGVFMCRYHYGLLPSLCNRPTCFLRLNGALSLIMILEHRINIESRISGVVKSMFGSTTFELCTLYTSRLKTHAAHGSL